MKAALVLSFLLAIGLNANGAHAQVNAPKPSPPTPPKAQAPQIPKPEVARLMTALDLPVDDAFLDACAKLVFPDARRRRDEIDWPAGVEDAICKRLAQYDFMQRYAEAHASAPTSA